VTGTSASAPPFVIALPLFNDWTAADRLLSMLDDALVPARVAARVLVIDDGSTEEPAGDFGARPFLAIASVTVLRLRRNLGHQRAIAIGLSYIERHIPCEAVILMDADGEDAPADVLRLVERYRAEHESVIVFAERRRRAERLLFRLFYALYRLLHLLLTGRGVRVGNFSVIPRERLEGLVVVAELWNHYAAAVVRSRQPFVMVPTARAERLDGGSSMDFVSLVIHGLSAISVYGDVVFVRLVVFASVLAAAAVLGLGAVIAVRVFTSYAIPGWATISSGLLVLVLVQALMFIASLTFLGLGARQQAPFVPARDYELYVRNVWTPSAQPSPVRAS